MITLAIVATTTLILSAGHSGSHAEMKTTWKDPYELLSHPRNKAMTDSEMFDAWHMQIVDGITHGLLMANSKVYQKLFAKEPHPIMGPKAYREYLEIMWLEKELKIRQ